MPVISQTLHYTAFGLRLASEIALPELVPAAGGKGRADVDIRREDLSQGWAACGAGERNHVCRDGEFWLHIPGVAIYRVRQGNRIDFSPLPGATETAIRLYLLGTCMGALLLQRRIYPLHGSAVVIDGNAYAIVGDSGAGKSTLAAVLLGRGHLLLSDDVIPVSLSGDGSPVVIPAYPQQKLWEESLEPLGLNGTRYQPLHESKYAIPVSSRFCPRPVPLAGVFELVKTEGNDVEMVSLDGLERLHALQVHTFRPMLVARMGVEAWHFAVAARMAGQIRMYQLRRPAKRFSAHELAARILDAASGQR